VAVVGREVQVDDLEEYRRVSDRPESGRHLHGLREKTISWLFFLTGNASVRRKDLLDVGGFDESFTEYGHEDLELGYRLARQGIRILYNPSAVNYHWHPVSFEEQCQKMSSSGEATVRMYRKHRNSAIKLRLGINPVSMLLHRLLCISPGVIRICRRRVSRSRFCREILLQYHYLNGVRRCLASSRKKR
jgi:GT2 family glycosyltransferase